MEYHVKLNVYFSRQILVECNFYLWFLWVYFL